MTYCLRWLNHVSRKLTVVIHAGRVPLDLNTCCVGSCLRRASFPLYCLSVDGATQLSFLSMSIFFPISFCLRLFCFVFQDGDFVFSKKKKTKQKQQMTYLNVWMYDSGCVYMLMSSWFVFWVVRRPEHVTVWFCSRMFVSPMFFVFFVFTVLSFFCFSLTSGFQMLCTLWMPPGLVFYQFDLQKMQRGTDSGISVRLDCELAVWTCDLLISHCVPVLKNQMKRKIMWSLSFNVDVWLLYLSFFFSFSFGWFGVRELSFCSLIFFFFSFPCPFCLVPLYANYLLDELHMMSPLLGGLSSRPGRTYWLLLSKHLLLCLLFSQADTG